MALTLYHAEPLANSMKPLLALAEKDLACASRYVDLHRFEQHEPWFVAINPAGQVPVLEHDGAIVLESSIILEYLEEVFPAVALLPATPLARAQARAIVKHVDDQVMPSVSMIAWHHRVRKVAQRTDPAEMAARIARIPLAAQRAKWRTIAGASFSEEELALSRTRLAESAALLERRLAETGAWLTGDAYGLADINAYAHVGARLAWFPAIFSADLTPRLVEWAARIEARPATIAVKAMPNHTGQPLSGTQAIEDEQRAG